MQDHVAEILLESDTVNAWFRPFLTDKHSNTILIEPLRHRREAALVEALGIIDVNEKLTDVKLGPSSSQCG
jgi:hypothetical protein